MWHSRKRGFEQPENQLYRKEKKPKNSTVHIFFLEPKKTFISSLKKIKTQEKGKAFFSKKISRTKPNKGKKAEFFSSYFSFKIAFKPNKGQKSQVSSQDHHD